MASNEEILTLKKLTLPIVDGEQEGEERWMANWGEFRSLEVANPDEFRDVINALGPDGGEVPPHMDVKIYVKGEMVYRYK